MKPAVGVAVLVSALVAAAPLPPLNEKVLEFAEGQKGQQVGDGECTTLAFAALRSAGARWSRPESLERGPVWGEAVKSLDQSLPGDVIQFENAVFRGRKVYPGGRYRYWEYTYPHHTAIVASVKVTRAGVVLGIWHQNVLNQGEDESKRKVVRGGTVRMGELREGTVKVYRPVGRHGVIWRKTSSGTDGEAGSRFVERMLTVVATCRQRGRDVLDFLTACLKARLAGTPAPSLLA